MTTMLETFIDGMMDVLAFPINMNIASAFFDTNLEDAELCFLIDI